MKNDFVPGSFDPSCYILPGARVPGNKYGTNLLLAACYVVPLNIACLLRFLIVEKNGYGQKFGQTFL